MTVTKKQTNKTMNHLACPQTLAHNGGINVARETSTKNKIKEKGEGGGEADIEDWRAQSAGVRPRKERMKHTKHSTRHCPCGVR